MTARLMRLLVAAALVAAFVTLLTACGKGGGGY
jgi:hypothetical protein